MMSFGLGCLYIGSKGHASVSEQEKDSILLANEIKEMALSFEENMEIVLSNYIEFEADCSRQVINDMIFHDINHQSFHMSRLLFDRRIMNFMTSCRSYVDHLPRLINGIMMDSGKAAGMVKKYSSDVYDNSLSYRIMEALRNYVQHRGLPVHGTTRKSSWEDMDGKRGMRHKLDIVLDTNVLSQDGKFKASVLSEMMAQKRHWSLREVIPEYVDGIGAIHEHVRDLIKDKIESHESEIRRLMSYFESQVKEESLLGLSLVEINADDTWDHICYVNELATDRRKFLEGKNAYLTSISKRYHTSR